MGVLTRSTHGVKCAESVFGCTGVDELNVSPNIGSMGSLVYGVLRYLPPVDWVTRTIVLGEYYTLIAL